MISRQIDDQKIEGMKQKHQMDIDEQVYFGDTTLNQRGLINNALVNARLQALVHDAVRGRVLSLYVMVYVGSSPIGSFVGGWVARVANVEWAIGGGAVLMLLFAVWAFRREPRLATAD